MPHKKHLNLKKSNTNEKHLYLRKKLLPYLKNAKSFVDFILKSISPQQMCSAIYIDVDQVANGGNNVKEI